MWLTKVSKTNFGISEGVFFFWVLSNLVTSASHCQGSTRKDDAPLGICQVEGLCLLVWTAQDDQMAFRRKAKRPSGGIGPGFDCHASRPVNADWASHQSVPRCHQATQTFGLVSQTGIPGGVWQAGRLCMHLCSFAHWSKEGQLRCHSGHQAHASFLGQESLLGLNERSWIFQPWTVLTFYSFSQRFWPVHHLLRDYFSDVDALVTSKSPQFRLQSLAAWVDLVAPPALPSCLQAEATADVLAAQEQAAQSKFNEIKIRLAADCQSMNKYNQELDKSAGKLHVAKVLHEKTQLEKGKKLLNWCFFPGFCVLTTLVTKCLLFSLDGCWLLLPVIAGWSKGGGRAHAKPLLGRLGTRDGDASGGGHHSEGHCCQEPGGGY